MAQVINTNSLSLITQNNINKNQSALSSSIERLSSGLRINSAKDDAAGQAIANRFTSNIKGLTQAARNANDGISLAQTTEGALSEINNNLQRVRELTVQATTGTNSDSDLSSIQDEIKSRLSEIDRVSGQTQFNGVNVLAKDGTMKIQVGANDGQTISIDLKKIDSDTLGLNGFNVNGSGTIANKAATISDLTAAKMDASTNTITTTNNALTASQAINQLKDGDTVTIKADAAQTATTYTYNAASGNFSFTNTSNNTSALAGGVAAGLLPPAGQTSSGVYKAESGEVNFDVDANGKITIGGQDAYLTTDGNLTTNNAGGATAAKLDALFTKVGDGQSIGINKTASITMGGTTYNFKTGADTTAPVVAANAGVSFTDTASKETVLNKVATAKQAAAVAADGDTSATITYKSGVQSYQAVFAAGDGTASAKSVAGTAVGTATATYTDSDGEMTTVGSYTTKYSIDANNGKVTVDSGTGTGKYAPKVGAEVYVSANGTLTTESTSEGTVTKDPLAALDAAISSIDKFRSSLGAIQNRLDSAVTNLNNTTTNLSEAQSRIQDADYATEVSNMSKAQIIQQAGNSVLAKANQVPQQVLSLLQG
ncbi:FliC/FljB family flagellin [Kluyvera ascorbata]|uniref:FliC/FljB family flagellin n=1 Tax=Kluyvera ascorbata TaxID=51288 RepID=UPI0004E43524|nr:FliC/FljB family flagellin [Kluyvera ascorbata]EJG2384692.1 flagellin FliC [Kluyvera ascorbata]KFD04148.1 FliC family flagellar biosynthesis protein [Kluyvera ascorbata ATCC 33433]MDU1194641.1 FliC/FljB family flagellin [Kluyvera ascorbata]BCA39163.1 flagellin [Kluyvera ascorbata]HBL0732154.1 flagellin FliC [Kluyvera ascorbata]